MRAGCLAIIAIAAAAAPAAADDTVAIPVGTDIPLDQLGLLEADVGELYVSLYCAPDATAPCELPAHTVAVRRHDADPVELRWVLMELEHEGIENYHLREIAVLLGPATTAGTPTVRLAISQLHYAAYDNGESFTQTDRQRVIDLDRDGTDELCIETWNDDRHGAITRTAFRVEDGTLVAVPKLGKKCPRRGYRMLVPVDDDDPARARRRRARAR